jgi:hypothetical protein
MSFTLGQLVYQNHIEIHTNTPDPARRHACMHFNMINHIKTYYQSVIAKLSLSDYHVYPLTSFEWCMKYVFI